MNGQPYTLEEVQQALADSRARLLAELENGSWAEPPSGEELAPLRWDFPLHSESDGGAMRRWLKKWIRHLTAWQWIPLLEKQNRSFARLFQSQASQAEELQRVHTQLRQLAERFEAWCREEEARREEMKAELARQQAEGRAQWAAERAERQQVEEEMRQQRRKMLADQVSAFSPRLDSLDAALSALQKQVQSLADEEIGYRLRRLEEKRPMPKGAPPPAPAAEPPAVDLPLFQHHFRGSEEEIRERQRPYLDFFRGARGPVADVGCGRGELLSLLAAAGIPAYGVEIVPGHLERLCAAGLSVRAEEGLAHLRGVPRRSLGGIAALHLLEHQPWPWIVSFLKAAERALAPGAPLLVETPNPLTQTGWHSFLLDPEHRQPLHPQLLEFFSRQAGFAAVEIRFIHPLPASQRLAEAGEEAWSHLSAERAWRRAAQERNNLEKLNRLLLGDQDYLLLARPSEQG